MAQIKENKTKQQIHSKNKNETTKNKTKSNKNKIHNTKNKTKLKQHK